MTYNILSAFQRLGIQTHRRGAIYVACCPFHNDKTPSLTIYPKTNSYFCFGNCEVGGGGTIDFVMRYKNISYSEAIDWLEGTEKKEQVSFIIKSKPKIVPPDIVLYYHSLLQNRQYFYDRGFDDAIINRELWGWDGTRYCIPIWEGEPSNSNCLGIRQRKTSGNGPKYIGLKNMNPATVWGRWYCKDAETIYSFAGEFDAALAVQDGLPAFSVVNGINAFEQFPQNWPNDWFPNSENLIVIFDRGEEAIAGKFASVWNKYKGSMKARIFHWVTDGALLPTNIMDMYKMKIKDYCEFRQAFTFSQFRTLLNLQFDHDFY